MTFNVINVIAVAFVLASIGRAIEGIWHMFRDQEIKRLQDWNLFLNDRVETLERQLGMEQEADLKEIEATEWKARQLDWEQHQDEVLHLELLDNNEAEVPDGVDVF